MTPGNNGQKKEAVISVEEITDPCPDCGEQLVHQEGIRECLHCGYQSAPC